jgi:hypothetical protein
MLSDTNQPNRLHARGIATNLAKPAAKITTTINPTIECDITRWYRP